MTHSTIYRDFTVNVNNKSVTTTVTAYGAKNDFDQWYVDDFEYDVGFESDDGDYLTAEERTDVADLLQDKINDHDWEFDNYSREEDYPEFSDEAV